MLPVSFAATSTHRNTSPLYSGWYSWNTYWIASRRSIRSLLPRAMALKRIRTNTRRRISSLYRKTQDGASYPAAAHTPEIGTVIDEASGALRRKTSGSKTSSPKTLPVLSWISGGSVKLLTSSPTFRWSITGTAKIFLATPTSIALPCVQIKISMEVLGLPDQEKRISLAMNFCSKSARACCCKLSFTIMQLHYQPLRVYVFRWDIHSSGSLSIIKFQKMDIYSLIN